MYEFQLVSIQFITVFVLLFATKKNNSKKKRKKYFKFNVFILNISKSIKNIYISEQFLSCVPKNNNNKNITNRNESF